MASNNEAKVTFRAETADFDSDLKQSKNTVKELNAEMRLAKAEFKNTGDAAEYLGRKHELLEKKLQENQKQQELLNSKIEVATNIFGEDSDEVASLETQLTNLQTAEQNIISEINDCNDAINENISQTEEAESALGQLTSEIESQEADLDELKQQYIDTALEMGTDSEEAQNLADQISTLSGELQTNKDRLEEVSKAADSFDQSMEDSGKQSSIMGDLFGGSIAGMAQAIAAGGVAGAVGEIVNVAMELGEQAIEMANDWSESTAVMAEGTGATGDKLTELTSAAYDAYKQLSDVNATAQSVAGTLAELNTRLGLSGDEATEATEMFSHFAKVTGQDAEGAVDDIVNVMKRWGMDPDINNIKPMLDDITTASQNCELTASDMTKLLSDNAYQFQALGYSADEALGYITAMADGGMNTSQITTALRNSVKNLTDATDDVPGAFQEAIRMIQNADGDSSVLNETIGDTGKTIEEVFGSRAAQEMVLSISTSGDAVDDFTQILQDNDGAMEQTYEDSITLKDEWARLGAGFKGTVSETIGPACTEAVGFFADLFDKNSEICQSWQENNDKMNESIKNHQTKVADALGKVKDKWDDLKTRIGGNVNDVNASMASMSDSTKGRVGEIHGSLEGAKTDFGNLSPKVADVKTSVNDNVTSIKTHLSQRTSDMKIALEGFKTKIGEVGPKFSDMKDKAGAALSSLQSSASAKMDSIKSTIGSAVDWLKGAFKFSWSLPKIKLPHFTKSGSFSLNPPSVPTFSVSWYKKAVDTPYLLRTPTIFGQDSNGNLMGGGETEDEIIFGKDNLYQMMEDVATTDMEESNGLLSNILNRLDGIETVIRESGNIYLNDRKVSEELAYANSVVTATRTNLINRGVLV